MTDYEMFLHLFNKLGPHTYESWGETHMTGGPRDTYSESVDGTTCEEEDFGSAIDFRTNGLIFDKQGNLLGHWAEYD
jgi:hypothetical protein